MNGKNILRIALDEIDSTNLYAKRRRGENEDMIVTARRQTGGMGTKGRSFSSDEGGVYLTYLRFFDDFPAERAFEIMIGGAVAVCETAKAYGLEPKIKWPNDILVGGKKLAGILIENTLSGGRIRSSLMGIGLNVRNPLPAELRDIAVTMRELGATPSVEEVTERLVAELQIPRSIVEYKKHLGFVGERIALTVGEKRTSARLLTVDERGNLSVEIEGEKRRFSFGEVSICKKA